MENNTDFAKSIDEMFSGDGWEDFADVLVELNVMPTAYKCRKAFNSLPNSLKLLAVKWGLSDTEVRDSAFIHLLANPIDLNC